MGYLLTWSTSNIWQPFCSIRQVLILHVVWLTVRCIQGKRRNKTRQLVWGFGEEAPVSLSQFIFLLIRLASLHYAVSSLANCKWQHTVYNYSHIISHSTVAFGASHTVSHHKLQWCRSNTQSVSFNVGRLDWIFTNYLKSKDVCAKKSILLFSVTVIFAVTQLIQMQWHHLSLLKDIDFRSYLQTANTSAVKEAFIFFIRRYTTL